MFRRKAKNGRKMMTSKEKDRFYNAFLKIHRQIVTLDNNFLIKGKYTEKEYKEKREVLRRKVAKMIKDYRLDEVLKLKKCDYSNICK